MILASIAIATIATTVNPSLAETKLNIEKLADGEYIFASQLPNKTVSPDVQLAGAEIYVFRKQGTVVIGEGFIANSSDTICFQGILEGSVIKGDGLSVTYERRHPVVERFQISQDLKNFQQISFADINYAKGSIQRCVSQFGNYMK